MILRTANRTARFHATLKTKFNTILFSNKNLGDKYGVVWIRKQAWRTSKLLCVLFHMSKLRLIFVIFLTMLTSSLVTWGVVKNNYESSFENYLTLSLIAQDAKQVSFQSKLYKLDDEPLRCKLAKLTRSYALGLQEDEVPNLNIIGGPGYPKYVESLIEEALTEYNQTKINMHAKDCIYKDKLY